MKRLSQRRTIWGSVFLLSLIAQQATAGGTGNSQIDDQYKRVGLNTITTAVPFLMISPDATAGGIGDAGAASTPDPNSIHWNPAKLAFVQKNLGLSVSYTPWLKALVPDINLASVSGYKKLDKNQAVGLSLVYFSLGDITFTDDRGNETGQFRPNEFAIDGAFSRKLSEKFSGGFTLRYINSNLTGGAVVQGNPSKSGRSVAADVSGYYEDGIEVFKKKSVLAFGLNISNIGTKISYSESGKTDFLPTNIRVGTALKMELDQYNTLNFIFDVNKLLVPTPPILDSTDKSIIRAGKDPDVSVAQGIFQSFYDAPGGFKEETKEFNPCGGIEYWYDKQFAIRAGFFYEHPYKGNRKFFTLGAGLKYNVFAIDFAYLIPMEQRNPLENTLRFTLLFNFDALKAENTEQGDK